MDDPDRLPRAVLPQRYDLTIGSDLDASTFSGRVTISVDVAEPTDRIVLNAVELAIEAATVSQGGANATVAVTVDAEREQIVLTCAPPLAVGPATIVLRFDGKIS